jgi:hypothetical protein
MEEHKDETDHFLFRMQFVKGLIVKYHSTVKNKQPSWHSSHITVCNMKVLTQEPSAAQ